MNASQRTGADQWGPTGSLHGPSSPPPGGPRAAVGSHPGRPEPIRDRLTGRGPRAFIDNGPGDPNAGRIESYWPDWAVEVQETVITGPVLG
jgi:hypothetical protein